MATEYAPVTSAPLTGHRWRRYAVLGDSVVEQPGGFADMLRDALVAAAPDLAYLNLGRRNLRVAEVHATQLSPALDFAPDLALVVCGPNDAMRPGYETRAAAVDASLTALIRPLQRIGAQVVTVSVFVMREYPSLPGWLGPGFARRMALLARHTTALAAELGTIHVDLANHPAIGNDEVLTGDDGLHGNEHSHRLAAAAILRRLAMEI